MENNIIIENGAKKLFVKGKASERVACDKVDIEIKFFAHSPIAAKASEAVTKQCERFLSKAKGSGIDISMIELLEDSVSDNSYRNDDQVRAARKLGLVADASVSIINLILAIIQDEHLDAAVETDYSISDEKEVRRRLKAKALEDSRETAKLLAESVGERISGVYSVDMHDRRSYYIAKSIAIEGERELPLSRLPLSGKLSVPTELVEEEIEVTWLLADAE